MYAFPFCHEEKKLDLASVDLSKMRVAELKQILHGWGEECRACAEKTDYVNLIKELAPKYAATHPQTELWLLEASAPLAVIRDKMPL